ncbi:hypothetical protein E4T56_gene20326 [Termitomyces sp. T112]|nr:hypothetical protein E4T56_gene20326 [Termitomyces sp. T112]
MSSSAYSPTASRSLSPPSQPSSSEDSEGCQDRRQIEAMYRSYEGSLSHVPQNTDRSFAELSAAVAGPSGPSSGVDVTQPLAGMAPSTHSKSGICPGVVRLVPESLRVVQAEVTPEQFAEVVGQARGPPTFEWCQAAAPCASCTRRGEQCEFEAPASGVRRDTLVCLPCHLQHEKCSVTLSWRAACIAAEQGWDQDWVTAQLEEGQKGRVSGRVSGAGEGEQVSVPAMKVGLWGGRREGAPSTQEKGKWRASPSPEAGPSKRAWGKQVMGGPPGSVVYSPTSGAPIEQSADRSWSVVEAFLRRWVESLEQLLVAHEEEVQGVQEERDGARQELDGVWREWDLAQKDKDIAVGTATEQLSCLQELEVRTVHLQVWAEAAEVAMQQAGGSGVRENQQGSSAGEVQVAAERAWQWEEWLANKAALGWQGVLHWARKHCILLDGASAALGSIHDGLARMPGDLLPELGQGVTQMGRLLAGHQWRATADPGAWWEMATDVGELLPGQPEVLAMVVAQLEVFMVGRVVGLGLEEEESVALPADQVLESAADYPGVEDLVDLVVILVLDFDGGRSAGEGDWSMLFKESNVEHRVEALQARRQVELVSMGGDLLEDLEWAEAFVVEFDGRPPGLEILPVKPDQGAGGPVGGQLATGIGVLGVGLVGSVDLVPEELVEGSEVLGDLVGNVGRDVFEGQCESGIVALVGVKGGNSGGGVRRVVVGEFGKGKLHAPVVL